MRSIISIKDNSAVLRSTTKSLNLFRCPIPALKVLAPLVLTILGGCTIHPEQEDVTRFQTRAIVDHIRCEARVAVLGKAIEKLRQAAERRTANADAILARSNQSSREADRLLIEAKQLKEISNELEESLGRPLDFDASRLPTDLAVGFYNRYINTVIAYEFYFDVTEMNGVGGLADPIRLISGGQIAGGLSASNNLTRNNVRSFKLKDSFGELLQNGNLICAPAERPSNIVYPIAGTIGVNKIIDNFIELYEDRPLSPGPDGNSYAEALQFTTEIKGAANPTIQLAALGDQVGLGPTTTIGLSASRKDIHKVTVGVAAGKVGRVVFRGVAGTSKRFVSVDRSSTNSNADRAFVAIERLRVNNFLDRASSLLR